MALFKRRKKEDEAEAKKSDSSKKASKPSMKDLYKTEAKPEKKKSAEPSKSGAAAPAKTGKSEGEQAEAKKAPAQNTRAYRVLVKPIITERSGDLGVHNKYVFEISKDANKVEVAKSIQEVYGVSPTKVNIIRMKGKRVRFGRIYGKRKDWKKAIVTLPQGKTINVYEGV